MDYVEWLNNVVEDKDHKRIYFVEAIVKRKVVWEYINGLGKEIVIFVRAGFINQGYGKDSRILLWGFHEEI